MENDRTHQTVTNSVQFVGATIVSVLRINHDRHHKDTEEENSQNHETE